MITVILYTKAGCGLCDEVKHSLNLLQTQSPHQLQEVDITQDDALFQKYRYTIPVVQVGKVELAAPITAVQLQHALETAV
ncbi:MAG: glutaredoxin family protein [Anaerolineales bacterium]|nr:glutaredoxin family protein [Anaerolineales bacterium]MCB8940091.1 glutaredoxin family protein [Ardenticatenaceae bacterium]